MHIEVVEAFRSLDDDSASARSMSTVEARSPER